jgi:hypothetical protein
MHPNRLVLTLVLFAALAGCSKPLAPTATRSGDDLGPGASAALRGRGGGSPPSFQVRLEFVGSIVTLDAAFRPHVARNRRFYVTMTGDRVARPDTVPAYSILRKVQWMPVRSGGDDATAGSAEAAPIAEAPSIVGGAQGDSTRVYAPGYYVLRLQAPPRAGGGTVLVSFVVGFDPVAWWAGPDPSRWPRASDGDGRAVDVTDWARFTTAPPWPADGRGYFGPDSFRYVPSQRRPVRDDFTRRTFYEIHGDRIYARSEGDTVHANAWVVLCNGGYDKDSPYLPHVDPADPGLPPGYAGDPDRYAVLLPQGLIGSPTGFRSNLWTKLSDGTLVRPSETVAYPNFDPASVFRAPHVAGYWQVTLPGKAYAYAIAEDADGRRVQIADPVALADLVDAGGGTPEEKLQRRSILTFFVRPPAVAGLAR